MGILSVYKFSISKFLIYLARMMSCQTHCPFMALQKDLLKIVYPKLLCSSNPQPSNSFGIDKSTHLQRWYFVVVLAQDKRKLVMMDLIFKEMEKRIMNKCAQNIDICYKITWTRIHLPPKVRNMCPCVQFPLIFVKHR